jgi:hypothetical protein
MTWVAAFPPVSPLLWSPTGSCDFGQAPITGGNLVGGNAGQPIAFTAGVQVVLVQSAASTIVTGGSALTAEEHTKLMTGLDASIPDAVWDEILANHLDSGTVGKALKDIKTKATLASIK